MEKIPVQPTLEDLVSQVDYSHFGTDYVPSEFALGFI